MVEIIRCGSKNQDTKRILKYRLFLVIHNHDLNIHQNKIGGHNKCAALDSER